MENNFIRAVPHTAFVRRLGAEKGNIDRIKGECFPGLRSKQDRLPIQEMAAGEINRNAIDAGESFRGGQAVRNNAQGSYRFLAEGLRKRSNGGSGVEINGGSSLNQLTGADPDTVFSVAAVGLAFPEGGESLVKIADSTAESPDNAIFPGKRPQIAPSRSFGNLK